MTRRKDGTYQEQITVIASGTKKQKYFYGKSPAEVKNKMLAYKGEQEKGRLFSVVSEEWAGQVSDIKHYTEECYKAPLKYVKSEFDIYDITVITPLMIHEFISRYAKKGYAKQSVRLRLIVLSLIFRHAILKGDVRYNPAADIPLPKNLKKTKRGMPDNDMIKKIKKMEMGLLPYFMLYTGLRREELLALDWKDIDFEKKKITVNKVIEFYSNSPHLRHSTKNEGSTREVILLDILAEKLKPSSGTVFKGKRGYMLASEFRELWERIGITSHQMRHAYITMLYEAGIDMETAMKMTGHKNITTIRNIYTHIRESKIDKAAKKLNKYSTKF